MKKGKVSKQPALRGWGAIEGSLRVKAAESRESAFEEVIRSIPPGKVLTYGQVAEAAGYPRYHRAVARFLSEMLYCDLPWQRVLGAGGEIKVKGRAAARQRALLKAEGVGFSGTRVDMSRFTYEIEL